MTGVSERAWKRLREDCEALSVEYDDAHRTLRLPVVGGNHAEIPVRSDEQAYAIQSSGALRAWFIGDFRAIWWGRRGLLEAEIVPADDDQRLAHQNAALMDGFKYLHPSSQEAWCVEISDCPPEVLSISLGTASPMLTCLVAGGRGRRLSLRIQYRPGQSPAAVALDEDLRRIANGVFFSVATSRGGTVYRLQRRMEIAAVNDPFEPVRAQAQRWRLPQAEYEQVPLHHYWHARSVAEPTDRFMGYYHVLEFYFLRCAFRERGRLMAELQREPNFDANEAAWQRRVEEVSGCFSSERDQLLLVVADCMSPADIRRGLGVAGIIRGMKEANKILGIFKREDQPSINIADPIGWLSVLTYSLRNRIVHTKDGSGEASILPGTPESDALVPYIHFLRRAAERALIAIGVP